MSSKFCKPLKANESNLKRTVGNLYTTGKNHLGFVTDIEVNQVWDRPSLWKLTLPPGLTSSDWNRAHPHVGIIPN